MPQTSAPCSATKPNVLIAWSAVLIGSALPELVLGLSYPLEATHWLSLAKSVLLLACVAVSVLDRRVAPLRSLFLILLAVHLATGAFGSIVSSGAWKGLVGGIGDPFIRAMVNVQGVRVGVTLVMLAALFILFRHRARFYLAAGDMGAKASRVTWLGISGTSSWSRVGLILMVILSLGTFGFLSLAMRPALAALPSVIPMLPLVLLFALTNALGEEIIYRLSLLAPTTNVVAPAQAMMMSAAYFGLAHYYGIPSGSLGVVMAGFLGWLACRSILDTKGVAWAFILHFVQDIWIFWFMAAMFSLHAKSH